MSITVWYRNITFLEKNQGVFFFVVYAYRIL